MKKISRRTFLKASGAACAGTLAAGMFMPTMTASADGEDTPQTYSAEECYQEGYDTCVTLEAEGAVLLKNKDNCLPLAEGTKVTILGAMSFNYVQGGDSQGADDEDTVMMNDAFLEAGLDVNSAAWDWLKEQCGGARNVNASDPAAGKATASTTSGSTWASYSAIHEFSADVYSGAKSSLCADGYTDYAVVTFARSGAEGASPSMDYDGDGSTLTGATYLELDQNEKDLLAFCKENFAHTIVLINSAAAMELGFIEAEEYNVDACLWIGHPGEAGVVGVGTLLTGRNNPSGRLADTYTYDVTTNPTYYNNDDNRYANADNMPFYQYEEGIYVGYRYYETADSVGYFDSAEFSSIQFKNGSVSGYDKVVQFPFGFGLSYTSFTEEIADSSIPLEAHGTNSITVKVTNTGSVAGKDVVELYLDAPYQTDTENFGIKGRGLEKAKVVLIGFGKTALLEPGESQDLTIQFDTDDLASYDNFGQGCYVLEAGEYKFNVQKDAHQWGDADSGHAPSASVSAQLETSYVYCDNGSASGCTYVGARSSDAAAARNCMDDVTAGDGCMLDGYLSRSDIAGGMKVIMEHTSNEAPNELLRDEAVEVLNLRGTNTCEYSFETYVGGVKTTLTQTFYAQGANVMPFAELLPDGREAQNLPDPLWEQKYYVVEGETGEDGLMKVVDAEPASGSYHLLSCDDMANVPIDTAAGLAIWDMLANETSLSEAIEVQGNCGWKVPGVASVGKEQQSAHDGPSEANMGQSKGGTWLPCEVVITSTWNTSAARASGVTHGHQDVLFGVGIAYGPGMNTHRSPFGGRNYEYFSEDGYLAGEIGGSVIAGIQSTGTSVFAKHMALNDGDTNRGGNTTWACEQATREIYMRPFEIACKKYAMNGIMGSMNRIGMSWFHYGLYYTLPRTEWGWQGFLITDSDGSAGDTYCNAQAMACVCGAMLSYNIYINDSATVAAYGEATDYVYTRYALHELMRNCLYQYCGSKGTDEQGNVISGTVNLTTSGSASSVPTGLLVLGGIGAAAVVAIAAALGIRAKNKKKAADAETEEEDTDASDKE